MGSVGLTLPHSAKGKAKAASGQDGDRARPYGHYKSRRGRKEKV